LSCHVINCQSIMSHRQVQAAQVWGATPPPRPLQVRWWEECPTGAGVVSNQVVRKPWATPESTSQRVVVNAHGTVVVGGGSKWGVRVVSHRKRPTVQAQAWG